MAETDCTEKSSTVKIGRPAETRDRTGTETEHKSRTVTAFLAAGGLLLLLFCCFLYWAEGGIHLAAPGGTESGVTVYWEVERLYYDENSHYYTIEGWAFIPAEEIHTYACRVLLQDEETGEWMELPGIMVGRSDLETRMPECSDSFQAMEY